MKKHSSLLIQFIRWRKRFISKHHFIIMLSAILGFGAGLVAIALKKVTHYLGNIVQASQSISEYFYLFPFLGIGITILIMRFIIRDDEKDNKHAISDVLFSIFKKSGRMKSSKMYSRFITSSLTVGLGGSAGLEAPVVMTGSAIGSNVGKALLLNQRDRILLIGCGTAAVISAIFNAPIAGLIFSIEVILFDITLSSFIPLMTASLSATLASILLYEDETLFAFRSAYQFEIDNILYYLLLGISMALIAKFFIYNSLWFEKFFKKIPYQYVRYLIGVSFLGLLIYFFPVLYGEGYTTIFNILTHKSYTLMEHNLNLVPILNSFPFLTIFFLIAIIFFKCLAFSFTIGAGGIGGTFAPSLFLGCVGGFTFAKTVNMLDLGVALPESTFALVGMAGVLSATQYAPLTAIFLIAELTGGYDLFVPLMIVSTISYMTVAYFNPDSPYIRHLIESGDYVKGSRDKKILSDLDSAVLIERDFKPIKENALLKDLIKIIKKTNRNLFPVLNNRAELVGYITLDFVRDKMFDKQLQETLEVSSIMKKSPAVIHMGEEMVSIINKFEETGAWNLPVIENKKYIGFISKSRIFKYYRDKLLEQV